MKAQLNDTTALLQATKSVLGFAAGHHNHHHHHSKSDSGRVTKHKTSSSRDSSSSVTEEMQVYFSKLKELVPFMPRNRKLSKLEIIQYVIDYICDLQLALEAHPVASGGHVNGGSNNNNNSSSGGGLSPVSPSNRQPLGVIANVSPNTSLTNTCAAQEANHDKLPSHLEEVNTRPVSC